MSGTQATLLVDAAGSATLSSTAIVPVLNGAVTGSGSAIAAQSTLLDLATFFATLPLPATFTSVTFSTQVISVTPFATPAALVATTHVEFASTVSGGVLMGFGTTNDVTLKNRAGTDVLGITANTLNVTLAGALAMTGALSGVTTLSQSDAWTLTGSAAAPAGTVRGLSAVGSTSNLRYNIPTGGTHLFSVNAANVAIVNANGIGTSMSFVVGANSTAGGSLTSSQLTMKTVAAIADNVGTAVLTVTVPNAAHSATIRVTVVGSLGAGGAIGANEASGTVSYDLAVTRTAGVNATVTASSAYGSGMTNVAGAATITVVAAASAISGAVGATNTFTVNVTIAHGSGASTNHTALVRYEVLNANASGVTAA